MITGCVMEGFYVVPELDMKTRMKLKRDRDFANSFLLETGLYIFGDARKYEWWLSSSIPSLKGETPASYINAGRAVEIYELLKQIEFGIYR